MPSTRTARARRLTGGTCAKQQPDVTEHVRRLVDGAPPLSPEQRDRLRLLLCPTTGRPMAATRRSGGGS